MKIIIITFLNILLLLQVLHAQVDESHTFVYLQNDSIVYVNNLWFLDGDFINKTDNKKFHSKYDIRFVNAENGFFADVKKVGPRRAPDLAKRTIKANINLYESQIIYVENGYAPGATQGALFTKKKYYNYFNKGYENLKRVNYEALYPVFSSNTESMVYLNKYRTADINEHVFVFAEWGCYASSVYLGFRNILLKSKNNSDSFQVTSFFLPLGVFLTGYGMRLVSNWFGAKKNEHLHESFIIYNGIK